MQLSLLLRNKPAADILAFSLIVIASPIIYIYGAFFILAELTHNSSPIIQFLAWFLATWIFIGILTNLVLIRFRHSTIRSKVLSNPVIITNSEGENENGEKFSQLSSSEQNLRHRNTSMTVNNDLKGVGQQFLARPFGSETAWHICSKCETYVPPRSWHCNVCKVCVLRRDHHCVFAMSCIGLENHGNFLGLLLYLSAGTIYATVVLMTYAYMYIDEAITIPWLFFRSAMPLYVLFFDFSFHNLLTSFCFICSTIATAIFVVYFIMSMAGETSGDRKTRQNKPAVVQLSKNSKRYAYKNIQEFLGPNPILRIIWPFHSKLQ